MTDEEFDLAMLEVGEIHKQLDRWIKATSIIAILDVIGQLCLLGLIIMQIVK